MEESLQRQGKACCNGIVALAACVLLMVVNSVVFAVSNGRNSHPTLQIGDFGLVANILGFVGAWLVFARCKRRGWLQSLVAISLLTTVHYILISNLWTFVAHRL